MHQRLPEYHWHTSHLMFANCQFLWCSHTCAVWLDYCLKLQFYQFLFFQDAQPSSTSCTTVSCTTMPRTSTAVQCARNHCQGKFCEYIVPWNFKNIFYLGERKKSTFNPRPGSLLSSIIQAANKVSLSYP